MYMFLFGSSVIWNVIKEFYATIFIAKYIEESFPTEEFTWISHDFTEATRTVILPKTTKWAVEKQNFFETFHNKLKASSKPNCKVENK